MQILFAIVLSAVAACGGLERGSIPVDAVHVRIRAQDTAWSGSYLFTQAGRSIEVPSGREIHLPLGAEVSLALESRDYICLFAMPGLSVRDFAAPGIATEVHFHTDRVGSYEFRGDELCGLPHGEETRGRFIVEEPAAFQSWVHQQSKKANR